MIIVWNSFSTRLEKSAMKKLSSLTVLSIIFLSSGIMLAKKSIKCSGVKVEQKHTLKDIITIKVSGAINLNITEGESESLIIKADENILPLIKVEISGSELELRIEGSFSTKTPLECNVILKNIKRLISNGQTTIDITKEKSDDLYFDIRGNATVNATIKADTLFVTASGNSSWCLAGDVAHQELNLSGHGKYNASKLESATANLYISGNLNVYLNARKKITGFAKRGSTVKYYGDPKVNLKTTGLSSIKKKLRGCPRRW